MYEVTHNLFRGPRPEDIRNLISREFQQVIVTQSGDEDRWTDSFYESQLHVKRRDPNAYPQIDVVYVRCSNIFPPTEEQVREFLAKVSNGKKTYVHCHSGVDRTGFLVACYRMMKLGWSYHSAYREWVDLGRHWWFDWWKYTLKKYEVSA